LAIAQNRIVFAQQDGIYTINPDGTDLKQVVQINAPCVPAWSPDKKQIAFAAFCSTSKKQEIYIVKVDGSGLKRITNNQSIDGWPAWSPDGQSLAFESDRDGDFEIYVIDNIENPTNVRQLTYNNVFDGGSAWSPDGKTIAFHSQRENTGGIYTMRPDGTNVTRVITSSSWIGGPDWSPNGNLIAFDGYYKGGFATIYTLTYLNPGSPKQLISTGDNWHPSWSPDGNWIVFLHSSDLWKMKSDGSSRVKIFDGSYAHPDPDW
jgi:TolB protein